MGGLPWSQPFGSQLQVCFLMKNKHPNHNEFCEFMLRSGQVQLFLSTDLFSLCAPSNPLTLSKTLSSPTLTQTFLDLLGY